MPKAGYVSLNVKERDAQRLQEYAQKNSLTIVSFAHLLAENLPDIDAKDLATLLKNASIIRFKFTIREEALKRYVAELYHYADAMHSIAVSLFPPVDLETLRVVKVWECAVLPYTALMAADVIDKSVDALELIRELENAKQSLKRILDKNWFDWEEVKPPPLLREIPIPKELLRPELVTRKDALEALSCEIKPFINTVADMCKEAEEVLHTISEDYPKILKLCVRPVKAFKKFFKL